MSPDSLVVNKRRTIRTSPLQFTAICGHNSYPCRRSVLCHNGYVLKWTDMGILLTFIDNDSLALPSTTRDPQTNIKFHIRVRQYLPQDNIRKMLLTLRSCRSSVRGHATPSPPPTTVPVPVGGRDRDVGSHSHYINTSPGIKSQSTISNGIRTTKKVHRIVLNRSVG